jgi:hypothetical protein
VANHGQRPPKQEREPQFPGRDVTDERCPDCDIDERLNAVGQRRFDERYGIPVTMGCETCGGTGRVPRVRGADGKAVDPMELTPKRPWWK